MTQKSQVSNHYIFISGDAIFTSFVTLNWHSDKYGPFVTKLLCIILICVSLHYKVECYCIVIVSCYQRDERYIAESVTGAGPLAEGSRVLEKVGPHSCSTSRSDSPIESVERKKKHKRKDKEKKEKVRDVIHHFCRCCCPPVSVCSISAQAIQQLVTLLAHEYSTANHLHCASYALYSSLTQVKCTPSHR